MTRPKRIAIYARVSTDGQSVENQRRELLAVAPGMAARGTLSLPNSPENPSNSPPG